MNLKIESTHKGTVRVFDQRANGFLVLFEATDQTEAIRRIRSMERAEIEARQIAATEIEPEGAFGRATR